MAFCALLHQAQHVAAERLRIGDPVGAEVDISRLAHGLGLVSGASFCMVDLAENSDGGYRPILGRSAVPWLYLVPVAQLHQKIPEALRA